MEGFKAGRLRVLVATDLAARGIDVDGISHVYNFELPEVAETYVHRIGRTARAGASGCAIALCDREEKPLLKAIEKLLRTSVPLASGPVFEKAAEEARRTMIAEAAAIRADPELAARLAAKDRDRYVDPRSRTRAGRRPEARREGRHEAVGPSSRRTALSSSSAGGIFSAKEASHGNRFDRKPSGRPSAGGAGSRERGGGARSGQRSR